MEVKKIGTENPILVAKTPEEMRNAIARAGLTEYVSGKLSDGTIVVASHDQVEIAERSLEPKLEERTRLDQARMVSEELAKMHQETQVSE